MQAFYYYYFIILLFYYYYYFIILLLLLFYYYYFIILLLFVRKLFKYNKSDMKPLLILLQPPWWLTLNVSLWLMSPDAKSLFKLD